MSERLDERLSERLGERRTAAAAGAQALRWQAAFEALARRATHEVNNAMNAVAMNLEVARLRAAPGADAGRVAPFAAAAAEAHEEVVAMVRALTALARGPLGEPCDVREVAAHVVALLAPGVRARGGALVLEGGGPAPTAASAAAVGAGITEALLDLTAGAAGTLHGVLDTLAPDGTGGAAPTLAFVSEGGAPVAPRLVFPSA